MKMNKKGFTLIEMLVVIAIIAVLVSIVVPVVSNSTVKSKAAADAANLRSIVAEASIDYLSGEADDTGNVKVEFDATTGVPTFTARTGAPTCETDSSWTLAIALDAATGEVSATFGGVTIDSFATAAESGVKPTQPTT